METQAPRPISALITGVTGFVGSHLLRRLIDDGYIAHTIVRADSSLANLGDGSNRAIVHRHDGSMDSMRHIINSAKPDIVFHLASLFLAEHQTKDVDRLITSNLLFGTQLLEALSQHPIAKIINTGTAWQHFGDADYRPVNLYAATKQAFESILAYYTDAGAMRAITLKLFDTYGPEDRRGKLFSLLRKAASGSSPLAMSPGEQLIDLVYIDDVVEAFVMAGERLLGKASKTGYVPVSLASKTGTVPVSLDAECFAVSSGNPIRLRELANVYEEVSGRKLDIHWGGRPYRAREVMKPWTRGIPLPGWQARVDLREGIRRMLAFSPS